MQSVTAGIVPSAADPGHQEPVMADPRHQLDTRTPPARKWLNSVQAADYAQCSTKSLYRAVRTGKLKAARIGRDLRFTLEWLDAWLLSSVEP